MRLTEPPSKAELESWKAVAGKCICNSVTFGACTCKCKVPETIPRLVLSLRSNIPLLGISPGAFDDMTCFPANAIGKLVSAYELVAVIDETNREMAAIQETMSNFMAELISKALQSDDEDEDEEEESE
jgi:hypothetical protein